MTNALWFIGAILTVGVLAVLSELDQIRKAVLSVTEAITDSEGKQGAARVEPTAAVPASPWYPVAISDKERRRQILCIFKGELVS